MLSKCKEPHVFIELKFLYFHLIFVIKINLKAFRLYVYLFKLFFGAGMTEFGEALLISQILTIDLIECRGHFWLPSLSQNFDKMQLLTFILTY